MGRQIESNCGRDNTDSSANKKRGKGAVTLSTREIQLLRNSRRKTGRDSPYGTSDAGDLDSEMDASLNTTVLAGSIQEAAKVAARQQQEQHSDTMLLMHGTAEDRERILQKMRETSFGGRPPLPSNFRHLDARMHAYDLDEEEA